MTRFHRIFLSSSLALFGLSQAVCAQNGLDMLEEADARNAAYKLISATEQRFNCEIEEHSIQEIGYASTLYLFRLSVEGDECNDALIFLTSIAAREDNVLFRQVMKTDQDIADSSVLPQMLIHPQILIHEVNPKDEESKPITESKADKE